MNVNVNDTSNRFYKLYLYAGPATTAQSSTKDNAAISATAPAASSGTIVQISDATKAASAALGDAKSQPADSVKAKVDALYAEVEARGSSVTFDISKPGELLDVSSLTDDELAQITNDKNHEFPQDLRDYAQGALSARLAVTLKPFENNLAAYQTGVQQLYKAMTPDVRAALGWDASMLDMSQKLVDSDEKYSGKLDRKSFLAQLIESVQKEGTLKVDTSLFGFDDDSFQ